MNYLNRSLFTITTFAAAALWSPLAAAHATLKGSNPAAGAVLNTAPIELALTFNEKLEPAFSSITLLRGDGQSAASAKASVDNANAAILRLALPALPTGEYTVKWAVAGHDGHRRMGDFKFSVK